MGDTHLDLGVSETGGCSFLAGREGIPRTATDYRTFYNNENFPRLFLHRMLLSIVSEQMTLPFTGSRYLEIECLKFCLRQDEIYKVI